jgi:hypothetical protein
VTWCVLAVPLARVASIFRVEISVSFTSFPVSLFELDATVSRQLILKQCASPARLSSPFRSTLSQLGRPQEAPDMRLLEGTSDRRLNEDGECS